MHCRPQVCQGDAINLIQRDLDRRAFGQAVQILEVNPSAQLIWASSRELFNIFQADAVGCHAITLTGDILGKLSLVGRDLSDYSLETVKMFYDDARRAGFSL